MPNLVGTGLNQVPINGMLGGLAYQDPEHASIKNLDLKNLSQINSEIADTAVDIFVYDTRKDSDGGAWRKRTQTTSWYNETLNTQYRGSRREFPAVAVIVAESTQITIYDGDDPDLPMWMVFYQPVSGVAGENRMLNRFMGDIKAISMLNGNLFVCANSTSSANRGGALWINFISEISYAFGVDDSQSENIFGFLVHNIAQRNTILGTNIYGDKDSKYQLISSSQGNDVAMTVLPNAPIDDATGLPIPTIAVATAGSVSVIKDDGSVADLNTTHSYTNCDFVDIADNQVLLSFEGHTIAQNARRFWVHTIPSSDTTVTSSVIAQGNADEFYKDYNPSFSGNALNYHSYPDYSTTNKTLLTSNYLYLGLNNNLAIINRNKSSAGGKDGMLCAIATDYNTGWMHGDNKGAFLSDTTNETMNRSSATELVTNGIDWTGASGTTAPTGWTSFGYDQSAFTIDSGRLKIGNGSNNAMTAMHQNITTVVGQVYTFYFDYQNSGSADYAIIRVGTSNLNGNLGYIYGTSTSSTSSSLTFVATSTTTNISVQLQSTGGTKYIHVDNLSVKAVGDIDRSVNNNGLAVYGTVTKTPVATGAELVGYSGFSGSNLLKYDASDMNFGTGDFSVSVWCIPSTDTTNEFILELDDAVGGLNRFYLLTTNTTTKRLYLPWDTDVSGSELVSGQWNHIVVGRKSGYGFVYVNNKWIDDGYKAWAISLNGSGFGTISNYSAGPNNGYAWSGSLALLRISASVPSSEQVKKMYEDEKVLFQENAKATLYGSSDDVTALAFDDTTNLLHVGTSAGRSDFHGLRRINNTTDAVTTAISASNGLVAEQ